MPNCSRELLSFKLNLLWESFQKVSSFSSIYFQFFFNLWFFKYLWVPKKIKKTVNCSTLTLFNLSENIKELLLTDLFSLNDNDFYVKHDKVFPLFLKHVFPFSLYFLVVYFPFFGIDTFFFTFPTLPPLQGAESLIKARRSNEMSFIDFFRTRVSAFFD